MCGTEIIKFSSFTLEVNKASQRVWGIKRRPFEKDIYEVAVCLKEHASAYPLTNHWVNSVSKQFNYRLRTKDVLMYIPGEFWNKLPWWETGRLGILGGMTTTEVLFSFTSEDRDLWLSYFKDKEILSHHNVPLTIDHRFHLIPFAKHLCIRKLVQRVR